MPEIGHGHDIDEVDVEDVVEVEHEPGPGDEVMFSSRGTAQKGRGWADLRNLSKSEQKMIKKTYIMRLKTFLLIYDYYFDFL